MSIYTISECKAALEVLGISELREQQKEPMKAVLEGRDVFAMIPAGGGKSLFYELPAVLEKGTALTLVISPLLALQRNQVEALRKKGIPAAMLNSGLSAAKRGELLSHLDKLWLLYLAPEQLTEELLTALIERGVSRVAVDEAHVLVMDRLNFRIAYGKIGKFINRFPERPQILALTATATHSDRETIMQELGMHNPRKFIAPIRRENLQLFLKKITPNKKAKGCSMKLRLCQMVEGELEAWDASGRGGAVIVYCPTVHRAMKLHKWLKSRGWPAAKYTGKSKPKARQKAYKKFMNGKRPIMIATNAFGLGIDKPDVRLVIHAGVPLSLDGYVQEIGRAGRDGKKSRCVLFYSDGDFAKNKNILFKLDNEELIRMGNYRLHALRSLLDHQKCLWKQIEKYYGQKKGKKCKKCCYCMMDTAGILS